MAPAGVLLTASAASWIARRQRLGKARLVLAALLLLAALIPQAGSLAYVLGPEKAAENYPIDRLSAHLQASARTGDVALVHQSWYKLYFDRYHRAPRPTILGAVQSGIKKTVPFGGTLFPITAPQVAAELARLRAHRRVFLVLSPGANEEWRDPRGLLEAALDRRYTLVSTTRFGVPTGLTAVVKLYDLGRSASARR